MTIWQSIAQRPHVVVAAVGTVALLGLSGSAIWMVLPADSVEPLVTRSSAASPTPEDLQNGKPARIASVDDPSSVGPSTDAVANQSTSADPPAGETDTASAEAGLSPLGKNDPRWIARGVAGAKPAPEPPPAQTASVGAPVGTDLLAAYGEDIRDDAADQDSTSAIPVPTAPASAEDGETKSASAGRAGRTARAVTMRSRPSTRGGVLGTVPARANVQVIACKQWCEIVYQGKRGFIYKGFLSGRGR